MIRKRCHHHAEQQQNIGKYDSHKQRDVTGFVLQDDTQTEPVKSEYPAVSLLLFFDVLKSLLRNFSGVSFNLFEIRTRLTSSMITNGTMVVRTRCIHIPSRFVGRKTVTSIIHTGTDIFKDGITQNISDHRCYNRDQKRRCHVMYQKFFSCITGSPQGSDHRQPL